jgi:hypothetical protein
MRRILLSAAAPTNKFALALTVDPAASRTADRPLERSAHAAASPNQVIVWNRILLQILRTPGAHPAGVHPARTLAVMHLAIADAVSAITRRYTPYRFHVTTSRHASQAAAAASAAHDILVALYPAIKPSLDVRLANSLGASRNGSGKTAGIAIGACAARSILELRRSGDPASARPQLGPGAPGSVTPFALKRLDQFRPGPPPPATSDAYVSALGQVRSLGAERSLTRTPDQTQIAEFWSAPIEEYWNEIAQIASLAHHDSVADDARLFALLNTSFADGVIACYDAKYAYRIARPATAIRCDGIPVDRSWASRGTTPADPSYPATHSVISSAAATTLGDEFGDRFDFEIASVFQPGLRRYSSFSAAALEAGLSRVYAGTQFCFDDASGQRLGRRVARFVSTHELGIAPSTGRPATVARRSRRRG